MNCNIFPELLAFPNVYSISVYILGRVMNVYLSLVGHILHYKLFQNLVIFVQDPI